MHRNPWLHVDKNIWVAGQILYSLMCFRSAYIAAVTLNCFLGGGHMTKWTEVLLLPGRWWMGRGELSPAVDTKGFWVCHPQTPAQRTDEHQKWGWKLEESAQYWQGSWFLVPINLRLVFSIHQKQETRSWNLRSVNWELVRSWSPLGRRPEVCLLAQGKTRKWSSLEGLLKRVL